MQTTYPLKVQAIRSQGQQPRLYVSFPLALAAAIGFGTRRFCAMGTPRSGRTSFSPTADSLYDNDASGLQKAKSSTIITATFKARPGDNAFIPGAQRPL